MRDGGAEDLGNSEDKSQLTVAKNMVKDLILKTEHSNSRAKSHIEYLEKMKNNIKNSEDSSKNRHYMKVMKELEDLKQELSKLKLDMASLLEEKGINEKKTEESKLKLRSCSSTAEILKMEIEEINEEQILFDLARIEALKESADIELQRKQDRQKHCLAMEEKRKQIHRLTKEIDAAKDLETELSIIMEDVKVLEIAKNQVKEMGGIIQEKEREEEANNPNILDLITKEIVTKKKELVSIRENGFKFMASMDMIRIELKKLSEETQRVKKKEERTEMAIQSLNAKLLRARVKLEAASLSKEKSKSIVSNLSNTFEQYKLQTEASEKEASSIKEETRKIKKEIDKTESKIEEDEEKLQSLIEELKSIKSSEAKALENLKNITETTMKNRALASKHSSIITISEFEYEYLRNRASAAQEIADKKVSAAQACIEALKASEKEILMKTDKLEKEIRAQKDSDNNNTKESIFTAKGEVDDNELDKWMKSYDKNKNTEQEKMQNRRSSTTNGKTTPARKGRHRVSVSPLVTRRRAKALSNITKLFKGKLV